MGRRKLVQGLTMPLLTLAGLQGATQYIAAAFGYHSALGAPTLFLLGVRVYGFWRFPGWVWAFGNNHPALFNTAIGIVFIAAMGGLLLVAVLRWRVGTGASAPTTYGSARWADEEDVRRSGLL